MRCAELSEDTALISGASQVVLFRCSVTIGWPAGGIPGWLIPSDTPSKGVSFRFSKLRPAASVFRSFARKDDDALIARVKTIALQTLALSRHARGFHEEDLIVWPFAAYLPTRPSHPTFKPTLPSPPWPPKSYS